MVKILFSLMCVWVNAQRPAAKFHCTYRGRPATSPPPPAFRPPTHEQVLAEAITLVRGTPTVFAKRAKDYNLLIGQALAKASEG